MKVKTRDFGEIEVDKDNVIFFENGLPGFEDFKNFVIIPLAEDSPFIIIQSLKEIDVAFTAVEPGNFIEDYSFEISDRVETELKISSIENLMVLNIITFKEKIEESTVNLSAPLIINLKHNLGRQVILDEPHFQLRYKLFAPPQQEELEVSE
ncbi:MAG: flagellar assembly protein FliW [Halanaerobium sp.]